MLLCLSDASLLMKRGDAEHERHGSQTSSLNRSAMHEEIATGTHASTSGPTPTRTGVRRPSIRPTEMIQ